MTLSVNFRPIAVIAFLLVALAATTMVGGIAPGWATARTATPAATAIAGTSGAVVREVLSSGDPASAPGQVLELVRYTISAGAQLPAHVHPGMQVAIIESGTLSYTVVEGSVPLTRAGTGETGMIDAAAGTVAIGPGDSFHEPEGVIHFGANDGEEPVVILVSSLFRTGEPSAELIEDLPATPAT